MFARTGPRMGVRFASGNVFYMNRTFTTRHLQSVASPLSTGFVTPVRYHTGCLSAGSGWGLACGSDLSVLTSPALAGAVADAQAIPPMLSAPYGALTPWFALCLNGVPCLHNIQDDLVRQLAPH
jgi:hypothetical protein